MRISAPAADACLLIHPFIRAFAACVRSIDQFSLNQHVMTSTGLLTEQEMQKKVVDELQASILAPNKVLMILWPWDQPIVLSRAW